MKKLIAKVKNLKHPLAVTIVGGVVVLLIGTITAFVFDGFVPAVAHFCQLAASSLSLILPVPAYGFVALCTIALLSTGALLRRVRRTNTLPPHRDYRADEFDGLICRWPKAEASDVYGMKFYCPIDDTEILFTDGHNSTRLRCESCGLDHYDAEKTYVGLCWSVRRQIDRRIRSGDWKRASDRIKGVRDKLGIPADELQKRMREKKRR